MPATTATCWSQKKVTSSTLLYGTTLHEPEFRLRTRWFLLVGLRMWRRWLLGAAQPRLTSGSSQRQIAAQIGDK